MLVRKLVLLLLPFVCLDAAVPKELQAVADGARALPPEFAADVLLKLAASPLATDPKWRRDAIEDAFHSSAQAQAPYPEQAGARKAPFGKVRGQLDGLTLWSRAVEAMLSLDSQRALTMFQDSPAPVTPKVSCQEAFTPSSAEYYGTAATLFSKAFSPEQRRKEADIAFLRDRVGSLGSPTQVAPALRMLDMVTLTPQSRNELVAALAGALERIYGGSREFGQSETMLMGVAVPEMHEAPSFLPAVRAYIVRHLSGPRCSDQIEAGQLPESANQFNKLISHIDRTGTRYDPITIEEATPLKDDGTFPSATALSARFQQVKALVSRLRNLDPKSAEWAAQYSDALQAIDGLKTEDEPSREEFWYESALLRVSLATAAPAGQAKRSVMAGLVHFMEQQYDSLDNRGLWFAEFDHVIGLAKSRPRNDSDDEGWFLQQLIHSRSSVISVYAQMEKLLGLP